MKKWLLLLFVSLSILLCTYYSPPLNNSDHMYMSHEVIIGPNILNSTGYPEIHKISVGISLLWSSDLKTAPMSPIVLYDINHDNLLDIIMANSTSVLVINGTSGELLTMINLPYRIVCYPGISIYEIPIGLNSSIALIYITVGGKIYCYNPSGEIIWQTDVPFWSFRIGVVDLNNDEFPEVVAYPYTGQNIYIFNGTNGATIGIIRYGIDFRYITFSDINNDTTLDIIASQRLRYLYAINGQNYSILWKTNTDSTLSFPHVVYYDDNTPIILLAPCYWPNELKIIDGKSGIEVKKIVFPTSARICTPPVVADINTDGILDVIVGSGDYRVYAISINGENLWVSDVFGVPTNIVLGDMDEDNLLDVVVVDDYGYVYIFDGKNGNLIWSYYVVSSISVCPAVGDIDGDGCNELVVATDSGYVYAFDFPQSGSRVYWGMFQGSPMSYGNVLFLDKDLDFLSDYSEHLLGTNDSNPDTDFDGIPDWYEVTRNLDPLANDASEDPDDDGLTNFQEYQYLTDPFSNDTDGDGLPDGWEANHGLNPLNATDRALDPDNDMLANWQEYEYGTDPWNSDTDGDGYSDGYEVYNGFDPLDPSVPTTTQYGFNLWLVSIIIACVFMVFGGFVLVRRFREQRRIREEKLLRLLSFMDAKRRELLEIMFRDDTLASIDQRIREGLHYYIDTGDEFAAAKLCGLSLDDFDNLRRRAGLPRVVFYEESKAE